MCKKRRIITFVQRKYKIGVFLNILILELKIKDWRPDFQWIGFGSVVGKEGWLKIL